MDTLTKFKDEFQTLPTDVQHAIRDLIAEINEVGLNHTGGCSWRATQIQFELALPVLQIISPSVAGEIQKNASIPAYRITWTANDFVVPDMNNLDEEAFSPLAASEPALLCRSTSGDDWCVTPKSDGDCPSSAYAADDCPSSYGIPITTWREVNDAIRIEALAAKSAQNDWCVTPKSVPAGDDCPSLAYADDSCPSWAYADDSCPS
jgi:hypothetical protein